MDLDQKSSHISSLIDSSQTPSAIIHQPLFESLLKSITENAKSFRNKSFAKDIFKKNLEFRRWLILMTYVLLNLLNGFAWGTYSPIIEESENYYSVDSSQILWFIYQFYILYMVFSFPVLNYCFCYFILFFRGLI